LAADITILVAMTAITSKSYWLHFEPKAEEEMLASPQARRQSLPAVGACVLMASPANNIRFLLRAR
jgi:hypothetical protein